MNAVAYLRVSSDSQDLATQRHAVERAAAGRGDTIGAEYAERESGGTMARPELRRLRADVAARRVRRLYVYALDRLTRTGILDTFTLVEEFRDAGCELVTVADPFDLAGPAAPVIVAVMAWAAQEERRRLHARLAAARLRVEAKGGKWGRPSRLASTDLEAIAVRVRAGETVRAIAAALKVPRSTVARVSAQVNRHDAAEGKPVRRPGWKRRKYPTHLVASRKTPSPGEARKAAPEGQEPPSSH